ncbi:MAG: Dam family site-specific DNA-(adenine-N6)-methyltransferase [Acidobacteria bacterium]|nr:Dam family site-specific DNA-(adenine-N6)-methyltransferase [Acidobacteriota bacterium]
MRPLLKWAGGKRQLLPALRRCYPAAFDRYVEPFVGSGAVFFDLDAGGRLDGRRVRLADVNADLIGCYRAVRDDPDAVIGALRALEQEHRARGADCFYDVRDGRFNPARASLGARCGTHGAGMAAAYTPALAAMFIYLNRTGYNGLFRLNRNGGFNVPAGRYTEPRICEPDHIRSVARALARDRVVLHCGPFDEVLAGVGRGDFVYCDPPYAPLSRTACFAHYTAGGFGPLDQRRLQTAVVAAARRGASVVVSNSSAPDIEAAYAAPEARAAGLTVQRVPARRAINSLAARRGPVDELVITNAQTSGPLRMARVDPARRRTKTA